MSSIEVWKPVVDYAGLYEVSDQGRVRSLDRVVKTSRGQRKIKGRTLKPDIDKDGYRRVKLLENGKATTYSIHRLVVETFIGPIPEGMHVDHLNNLPGDNRLENLQMVTPQENTARQELFGTSIYDRAANGEHHHTRKSHCPRGHNHFEENNIPSHAKTGRRACLICSRADSYIRKKNIPSHQHWAVFDYYLERFLLEARESVSGRVAVER